MFYNIAVFWYADSVIFEKYLKTFKKRNKPCKTNAGPKINLAFAIYSTSVLKYTPIYEQYCYCSCCELKFSQICTKLVLFDKKYILKNAVEFTFEHLVTSKLRGISLTPLAYK